MAYRIQRTGYFLATVKDQPGEAYKLLSALAARGINLVAFTAVPTGPLHTQLTIFPEDAEQFIHEAKHIGLGCDGPHPAFLVQGDDELGALAGVHLKLSAADINVYASSGVADGKGSFGYVIYVRPDDYESAASVLEA
jgi:hypothetical protein